MSTAQTLTWRRVSEEEWRAFIEQFPDRRSYRTGICEPPKEICESPPSEAGKPGRSIASITFGDWPEGAKNPDWNAKVYEITDAAPLGT